MNATNSHIDTLDALLREHLSAESMPADVQHKLRDTYRTLPAIPQLAPAHKKRIHARHGLAVLIAAAMLVLAAGGAVAATRMLQMGEGEASFFATGNNLSVYDSMEPTAKTMSAQVGESMQIGSLQVTVDSISCDRSIANVYLTVSRPGGINIDTELVEQYPFSDINERDEWSQLRWIVPDIFFQAASKGEFLCSGIPRKLDYYMEDGTIKVLLRLIMDQTLPEETEIILYAAGTEPDPSQETTVSIGLDLSNVVPPKELTSQTLYFNTSQGEKHLILDRFATSELGTVLLIGNEDQISYREDGNPDKYGAPDDVLNSEELKMTDDAGNILQWVDAGDGLGYSIEQPSYAFELTNLAPDAKEVVFTPMLHNEENLIVEDATVLFTQLPADVPDSDFGGYTLESWEVSDGVSTLSLKPYGWIPLGMHPELREERSQGIPWYPLAHTWTKWDYQSGELVDFTAYATATDEEIRTFDCAVYTYCRNSYLEEADAARTLPFEKTH